jgi:hypothetical protein
MCILKPVQQMISFSKRFETKCPSIRAVHSRELGRLLPPSLLEGQTDICTRAILVLYVDEQFVDMVVSLFI